ncbi:MAG TPA: TlpA disulfide reductase family protein [Phototrophicaceae bacterium]|nr:TlpA disulfide reductase family protein [Phototrophicaceae bacterium]
MTIRKIFANERLSLAVGAAACLLIAVALVIAAGLPNRAAYSGEILANGQSIAPEIGSFAPPFSAPTLDSTVSLTDLRGTPLVINFWATWCVPCGVEMPELQAFHLAHPNTRVLAINLGESRPTVVDWVTHLKLTFDIVLDPTQSIATLYRLRGQPSTYVVSPGGVITTIFYGPTTRQSLESALQPFLRG